MGHSEGDKARPHAADRLKPVEVQPLSPAHPPAREIELNTELGRPTIPVSNKPLGANHPFNNKSPSQGIVPAGPTVLASRSPSIFDVGDVIHGRFKVLDILGRGGQGITFKCHDAELRSVVVLKCLRADGFDDDRLQDRRRRLKQEASLGRELSGHRHIPQVYDVFEAGAEFFICMQHIDGATLLDAHRAASFGALESLTACLHIARALEVAHTHEPAIIHRDVKPANVLIHRVTGEAWLIDFGYARYESKGSRAIGDESDMHTRTGAQPGTPRYMSPEQPRGDALDASTDVWSLGCVLYECLSKSPAFSAFCEFDDSDHPKIDWQRLEASGTPVRLLPDVKDLLVDCLRRHRRHRPSISKVALELHTLIHELQTPGPAPAPAARAMHNLPRANPLFCGRTTEVEALGKALLAPDASLVTITSIDGMGKSSLATETARRFLPEFSGGAWIVDAHNHSDPASLVQTLGELLGVASATISSVVNELRSRSKAGKVLLVVDGCDKLSTTIAPIVLELLAGCDGLRILATFSTTIKELERYKGLRLKPLRFPEEGMSMAGAEQLRTSYGAVELFHRVARLHTEDPLDRGAAPASIARICRRVSGLPLAILLIAPLVRCMSPEEIADMLEESAGASAMEILSRTFGSSYERLTPVEQALLRRLTIFEGGWTARAARQVCGDASDDEASAQEPQIQPVEVQSLLISLFDKAMIEHRSDPSGGTPGRYDMLGPIREFLRTKIGVVGDASPGLRWPRHLAWCEQYVTSLAPDFDGDKQAAKLAEVHLELPNILAALGCAKQSGKHRELGLRLAAGMRHYWFVRGPAPSGLAWLDEFAPERAAGDAGLQARVANAAGTLSERCGKFPRARAEYEAALGYYRETGDQQRISALLNNLATICGRLGDWENCQRYFDECLHIREMLGDRVGAARAELNFSSRLIEVRHEYAQAEARLIRARPFLESDDKRLAMLLNNLGECARALGRPAEAIEHFVQSCRIKRRLGNDAGWRYSNGHILNVLAELKMPELAALVMGIDRLLGSGQPPRSEDVAAETEMIRVLSQKIGLEKTESLVMFGSDERNVDSVFDSLLKFARECGN